MESRDSSLPSAATRDGASQDDDAALSVDAASLARDAALLFQSRKFSESLDVLNQLRQKKEDPKVFFSIFISLHFCLSTLIFMDLLLIVLGPVLSVFMIAAFR